MSQLKKAALFLSVLLVIVISGCAQSLVTGDSRLYGASWEEASELGNRTDQKIKTQMGVYHNADLNEYVRSVGMQVLAESDLRGPDVPKKVRETEFVFRVLDEETPNAMAVPGGHVYVTVGLLKLLENEAQLATVLGHELGHLSARHVSQRLLNARVAQGVLSLAAILGEQYDAGDEVAAAGKMATKLTFLKFSRDDERESDRLGVEYAARAGYAVGEVKGFFAKLDSMQGADGAPPTFLSSHPDPGDRQERITELADKYQSTRIGRRRYQKMTADL